MLVRRWAEQPPPGLDEIDWAHPLTRGLVFLWPGRPGNYIDLVKGRRGAVTGSPGGYSTKDGRFASFEGGACIDFPTLANAELSASGPSTIAWRQANVSQSTYGTLVEVSNATAGAGSNFLVLQHPSDAVGDIYHFSAGPAGGSSAISWHLAVADATTPVGKANRYVLTATAGLWDSSNTTANWRLFENRTKLAPTSSGVSYSGTSATTLKVGADEFSENFNGQVGMLAFWNRVLTDQEAFAYNENPFQILRPRRLPVFGPTAGAVIPVYGTLGDFDPDLLAAAWF